ncbi:MAG TPA: hypothetical protein VFG36_07390, partial [Methanoregula sp.]|nr:hypothetical protein [Methanoregula sp.]
GQKGVIEDLIPWLKERRLDILQHVSVTFPGGKRRRGNDIAVEDLSCLSALTFGWTQMAKG